MKNIKKLLNILSVKKEKEEKELSIDEAEIRLSDILRKQNEIASGSKCEYEIARQSRFDIRHQLKKAKSFLDLNLIPAIYITETGNVILTPCVIYTTHLGTYAKFYDGIKDVKREVRHVIEIQYLPSGKRQIGILIDAYTPISIKVNRNLSKDIKKQCEDLIDTMVMIEKHFLSKVLTDIFGENKITLIGAVIFGIFIGFFVGKII